MSHLTTIYDWANRFMNEFNELRIGATDVIKMKLSEFFVNVMSFMAAHSTELLYGSVSVFFAILVGIMFLRAKRAEFYSEGLEQRLRASRRSLEFSYATNEELMGSLEYQEQTYESMLSDLRNEMEEVRENLDQSKQALEKLREEFEDLESDRDEHSDNATYWEEQCDDARSERDDFESDLDDAKRRIEILESLVETYEELADNLQAANDSSYETIVNKAA
ncbi:putative TMhelix containing protein III [Vibrio virus VPMCC5]|nr:putative TMhelix containing protein III [Vibrio virus VPMCC5]